MGGNEHSFGTEALLLLTLENHRGTTAARFATHHLECISDLLQALDGTASQTRTTKLWVDCLIKPIFVILKYIRAEREADCTLHLGPFVLCRRACPLCPVRTLLSTDYGRLARWQTCALHQRTAHDVPQR